jgi:hypothetical protein
MVDEPRSYASFDRLPVNIAEIESELQALAAARFDVATFIFGFKFAGGAH